MKATSEKQRKRQAVSTSGATRKVAGKGAGVMPAARALTEHVVQFKDGSTITFYVPAGASSELKEKVAATKDISIVEVGSGVKGTIRGVRGVAAVVRQMRAGETESRAHTPPESASDQIVTMATKLTGTKAKAQDWYKTFPIPAFGGLTAEFLVDHGRAKEVREYLNAVVLGEFA